MSEQPRIQLSDLFKATVGEKGQARYVAKFKQFHRAGKVSASWNWAAFFATFIWLMHRKMWGVALAYLWLPPLGLLILTVAVGMVSSTAVTGIYVLYTAAIFVLPALYADAIYFRFCKRKIEGARTSDLILSPAAQKALLAKAGGTWHLALVIGLSVGIPVAVASALATRSPTWPESAEEVARIEHADRARLDSAVGFGAAAGKALTAFHRRNGRLPQAVAETAMGSVLPAEVQAVQIDPSTGELRVVLAIASMDGRSLRFAPYTDATGAVQWQCHAGALPAHLIPEGCTTR